MSLSRAQPLVGAAVRFSQIAGKIRSDQLRTERKSRARASRSGKAWSRFTPQVSAKVALSSSHTTARPQRRSLLRLAGARPAVLLIALVALLVTPASAAGQVPVVDQLVQPAPAQPEPAPAPDAPIVEQAVAPVAEAVETVVSPQPPPVEPPPAPAEQAAPVEPAPVEPAPVEPARARRAGARRAAPRPSRPRRAGARGADDAARAGRADGGGSGRAGRPGRREPDRGSAPAQGDTEAEQVATPVASPEPPAPDVAAVGDSLAPVVEDATESLAPVVGNRDRAAGAGG